MKDGEVTYKKFETGQLMGSIQLGIQNSVGNLTAQVLTILIFIFIILIKILFHWPTLIVNYMNTNCDLFENY